MHFLFTDIKNKKRISRIIPYIILKKDSFRNNKLKASDYFFDLDGIKNFRIEKGGTNLYEIEIDILRLSLVSKKKPLLINGKGFIDYGKRKSYYYSLTNLEAKGEIKIDGKSLEVFGRVGMTISGLMKNMQKINGAGFLFNLIIMLNLWFLNTFLKVIRKNY